MNEDDQKKPSGEDVSNEAELLLSACQKQRDEYLNGWKRAQADLANYKKDEMKRLEEISEYSAVGFVKDVLPVLDSFGFALVTVEKDSPAYKGIVMIQSQLLDILKRRGVEKIAVSKGDEFNPEFHEAMMEVDAPPGEENLSGKILEELVAGYVVKGRVVRAVKVKLVK
jgi:molecular chaperone GrpE